MCGEKPVWAPSSLTPMGSPPRARGKETFAVVVALGHRITPACAGKSHSGHPAWAGRRDHPRVCGEKWLICACMSAMRGSPPPARGKVVLLVYRRAVEGITPACAGKSRCTACAGCAPEDHPRVCREKCKYRLRFFAFQGSPPRVRGKD